MRGFNPAYAERVPVQEGAPGADKISQKEKRVNGNAVLGLWGGLLVIYILWDYVVLGNKELEKTLSVSNIRTNLYNLVVIGFASIIFINIAKVIVVKLAAWNIPIISWLAEEITPLFEL